MCSLFKSLKRKAMSSVHTRKAQDASGSMNRSPFATDSTDILYPGVPDAESVSAQDSKSTAFADLASRVSSEGVPFDVTSAADFLSDSRSSEENANYETMLHTSWPFSSFCAHESDGEEEELVVEQGKGSGKLGTFEFSVPEPVPVEESDKPVSTLFKWGTAEASKGQELAEAASSSGELHHYDTWRQDDPTPFDRVHKSGIAPFSRREDSAQQGDVIQLDTEDLCLEDLTGLLAKAHPGMTLDLAGKRVQGDGCLRIAVDDVTLKNGTLELKQGVTVMARRVTLADVTVVGHSSKVAAVSVLKKECLIRGCHLSNATGVGLLVTGKGSRLTLQQTVVADCERSCVCVNSSAVLKIEEDCSIRGSRSFHGIAATDEGTELWIQDATLFDHFQDAILVTNSAQAALKNCEIFGSRTLHGIAGRRSGTTIVLKNCHIYNCHQSALIVEMGAKAKVTDCEIQKSRKNPGVFADGHGSHVDVLNSKIVDCDVGGVFVSGRAGCKITRTHISGGQYGNGFVATEAGTNARLQNSTIFQTCRNGVLVMDGANLVMEGCDVSSSTAANGVLFKGSGSQGQIERCQFAKNHTSNLCLDAGAVCRVAHCRFSPARHGPSVIARGGSTLAKMTLEADVAELLKKDAYIFGRARMTVNDKTCKNKRKCPKLKQTQIFSSTLPFSADAQ